MKILAIDTATATCGVAIVDAGQPLAQLHRTDGVPHATCLMEMVQTAFETARCRIEDLDGIAVTRGPGSFTGVRIAMSTAKGLALACRKPVVGVSTLRALALQTTGETREILALIDARRGEVYHARFRWEKKRLDRLTEDAVGPVRVALAGIGTPGLLVGNGALLYQEEILATCGGLFEIGTAMDPSPRAVDVARVAWPHLMKDGGPDPERALPVYLRKSDAENTMPRRLADE